MPIPEFVADLRSLVGSRPLWLPGSTAVVRKDDLVLFVQRSDNGAWTPITGVVDPGEDPAATCVREAREEAGVEIRVDRLAGVFVLPETVYENGDRSAYLDVTFACTWLSGEPYAADDESTAARWFPRDSLPHMPPHLAERVEAALSDEVRARFRT